VTGEIVALPLSDQAPAVMAKVRGRFGFELTVQPGEYIIGVIAAKPRGALCPTGRVSVPKLQFVRVDVSCTY